MSKPTRWATPEEIHARAEMLRTLMIDAAVDQFAELQHLKAQIATLTQERDEARQILNRLRGFFTFINLHERLGSDLDAGTLQAILDGKHSISITISKTDGITVE